MITNWFQCSKLGIYLTSYHRNNQHTLRDRRLDLRLWTYNSKKDISVIKCEEYQLKILNPKHSQTPSKDLSNLTPMLTCHLGLNTTIAQFEVSCKQVMVREVRYIHNPIRMFLTQSLGYTVTTQKEWHPCMLLTKHKSSLIWINLFRGRCRMILEECFVKCNCMRQVHYKGIGERGMGSPYTYMWQRIFMIWSST